MTSPGSTGTIAIVTDSNSQLPAELAQRYGIRIVPIPVVVNGSSFLEGIDLDADQFYEFFDEEAPEVSTSQPAPGVFAETYADCVAAGATEIVSVHVAESLSGTLNSARLGARSIDVPVHLVDSRTLSFGVGCCAWVIGQALVDGNSVEEAIARAERLAGELYSVSALGAANLLSASGRAAGVEASNQGIDVYLAGPDARFESVGAAADADTICDLMASAMHADGAPIRVALGIADETARPYYEGLEQRLAVRDDVVEIVRYRIGPSVGAYTGLGTAGGFWFPADI